MGGPPCGASIGDNYGPVLISKKSIYPKELEGKKIAVLCGGLSCEREISLLSGRAVYEALSTKGFDVFMMDPVGDFVSELKKQGVEFVFLALHGSFGEDGAIQKIFRSGRTKQRKNSFIFKHRT